MNDYKVGTRIKNVAYTPDGQRSDNYGKMGIVDRVSGMECSIYVAYDDGCAGRSDNPAKDYKIIKTSKMKKLGIMMKKLLDTDTQTLVKAGYINGDLELTGEGEDALITLLFDDKKADLVNLAQSKLDDEEKEDAKK